MTHTEPLPVNRRLVAYMALFVEESRARLAEMMLELAGEAEAARSLSATERAVHQIAGSAAVMGCEGIAAFARIAERFVRRIQRGDVPFGGSQQSLLIQTSATLTLALDRVVRGEVAVQPSPGLGALLETWAPAAAPGRE